MRFVSGHSKPSRSQSGMTLIELMVAVALSGLVLVSLGFITQAMFQARRDVEAYDAEKDLYRAEFLIRNLFATGLNVRAVDAAQPALATDGWVLTNYDSLTAGAGVRPVAIFKKEGRAFPYPIPSDANSAPGRQAPAAANQTLPVQVGLFFIPPAPPAGTEPHKSGVLFIDQGNTNVSPQVAKAGAEDELISNLVSFQIVDPQESIGVAPNTPSRTLLAFTVRIVHRRFMSSGAKYQKCFLPTGCPGPMAASPTEDYTDQLRSFRVLLFNANIGSSVLDPGAIERTFGRIYFFRMLTPLQLAD